MRKCMGKCIGTGTVLQVYGTGECMGECRGNTTGTVVGLSGTVLILTQKIINSTWRLLIWLVSTVFW